MNLRQLVQAVVRRVALVPGTHVQLYAEDRIADMIQHKFITCLEDLWWPDLMRWHVTTLGNNGKPSGHSNYSTARDIRYVYYKDQPIPLPRAPDRYNIAPIAKVGTPMFWEPHPDDNTSMRVLPYGTVGDAVSIRYRKRPTMPFGAEDEVPMDDQLLILGATWDYLEDDATAPGAAAKFANLFNQRMARLRNKWNGEEIAFPSHAEFAPSDNGWQEL